MAVKGWAAPEVERAYTRARELCELLDDPPQHFSLRCWDCVSYIYCEAKYESL